MTNAAGCLILACGNTLRSDDGVGPHLADWAAQHFASDPRVRVISRQQWTPELAHEIATSEAVLFLDCSIQAAPGIVQLTNVQAASASDPGRHHLDAASLLALTNDLYGAAPNQALQLTIGAASTALGDHLSPAVAAAFPGARSLMETTVHHLLGSAVIADSLPA